MAAKTWLCSFIIISQVLLTSGKTNSQDSTALTSLQSLWKNAPPTWTGDDPCGGVWEGIDCNGTRVISIRLASMGLQGTLSGDIQGLSELQTLDLSYNKGLTGTIPDAIGALSQLVNLILVSCGFSGQIPDSIGSLSGLYMLSLNSNSFSGNIPGSIGKLKSLYWLDLADNQLSGSLPISTGNSTPGLDWLVDTKHFHFGKNNLSGSIPSQLFNSSMHLIHLLLDNNKLAGDVPSTLTSVTSLEVLRLDENKLQSLPSSISNLTSITQMILSNNIISGLLPNLSGMTHLTFVDMSNNSFLTSEIPSWFSALPALTTLKLERVSVRGQLPATMFTLSQLQTVILRGNYINGTLDFGSSYSTQLDLVDLENNIIDTYTPKSIPFQLILEGNPVCDQTNDASYCKATEPTNSSSYSTQAINCNHRPCNSSLTSSPTCTCSCPYSGSLVFRAPTFSNLGNNSYFTVLETSFMDFFSAHQLPVDSVALSNVSLDASYLSIKLEIFPFGLVRFNRTAISQIGFSLSNQTFKPPKYYGPYYFIANDYIFGDNGQSQVNAKKGVSTPAIIGIAVGATVLFLLLLGIVVVLIVIFAKRAPRLDSVQPVVMRRGSGRSWDSIKSFNSIPQVSGARWFTLNELKKCTNDFSEANDIGTGGYGKVYKGSLPNGQLVAVKRADPQSTQGGLEFKTEIEHLSRVHHRNLVTLLGFCYEQGELTLVYEYVANGTLRQSLTGKSGVRLDWRRRVKVTLGAARGLHYLHDLANPPIIHRDIKSNNILIDETLNPKVADFGLAKSFVNGGKGHISTQVKGTMGYLDPEYYMTQKLTEKSDVYSFGVLMLEMVTGKAPIERGRYIVREIRKALDKSQDLYNLQELLDPTIGLGTALGGFEKFVEIALRSVEESGSNRPSMREVVHDLEQVMEEAGLNPYSDSSATSSAAFPEVGRYGAGGLAYPYPEYGGQSYVNSPR